MVGPLGKIAAFFSSNGNLHQCSSPNNNNNKELKKAANAAQLALKRRNRRNEWYYGEAGPPRAALAMSIGGSSEDVHAIRTKFSRKNPVWSSLRDLRSQRRPPIQVQQLSRSPNLQDACHRRPTSPPHPPDHNGRLQLQQESPSPSPAKAHNGTAHSPLARKALPSGLRSPNTTPPASRGSGAASGAPAPAASTPTTPPSPSPQQVALDVHKRLLPDLRHNAAAFEAMAILLKHVTSSMDIFAVPRLRRELENTKNDIVNTVAELEQSKAGYQRLEEQYAKDREELESARRRESEEHQAVIEELKQKLSEAEAEERTLRLQLDSHADSVTRALREEYEAELDRVTRRHEETLGAALGAAREAAEREAAARAAEAARREAEVLGQLRAKEVEHEALREQSRKVMDSMKSDKDSRTQALAARCRELQDEVDSLRSVLELRCSELLKSRRENDALRIAADALPGAEQKISTLTARLEDLQVQLDRKTSHENKLNQENSELQQSFHKEIKEKQMLSLQNEQLQFKLKQNSEIVNALTNMSGFSDVSALLNSSLMSKTFPTNGWGRHQDQERNRGCTKPGKQTPPESPKVKGVVEKSESVSWVLEMESESTEDIMTRLCRRVGSSSTPVVSPAHSPGHRTVMALKRPSSGPPHHLTQSASVTTMPCARSTPIRSNSASARSRSRSISSDSAGECNWSPPPSLLTPDYPKGYNETGYAHQGGEYADDNKRPVRPSAPIPGCDYSDIEDFSSSKSSSMSCSSEGSELGAKESDQDHDLEAHYSQPQDVMTASCGSASDLLIAKQATLPKDAGGEAMISEEMTEDDANGIRSASSCDGSCSEEESGSSTGEGGLRRTRVRGVGPKPFLTLPIVACAQSAGQSANNTPMDSSWSEDIELPVSLSES